MFDRFYYTGDLETAKQQAISNCQTEFVWLLHSDVDYNNFDLRWVPNKHQRNQAHVWSSHNNPSSHTTWLIPQQGFTDINFHDEMLSNSDAIKKIHWPNFVETTLTGNSWQDSLANWLLENENLTGWTWIIDSRLDYSNFNFNWLPDSWDQEYIHCFALAGLEQLSYTWLVNASTLKNKKFKYHKSNLKIPAEHTDLVLLDMNNDNFIQFEYSKRIRYTGRMEDVLRNAIKRCNKEWLWVASSCSNYNQFQFNWIPDLDQIDYAHCWPAPGQIKGETFLIHIPSFLKIGKFKWNFDHPAIRRYPWPGIKYTQDNIADAINQNERLASLYTVYYKPHSEIHFFPEPCLWDKRPVVGMSECNSVSLIPRDCVVEKEIYEYPYLERNTSAAESCDLDIIFLHNGESNSTENWLRLLDLSTNFKPPPKMVKHVTPRLAAYQAAARLSDSDWFLAVFAKCHMTDAFKDFTWRPDYWQQAKHYIFYNHNLDLDLTYGHMAPIAYNQRLMLENTGGLDMTLVQAHAVIPQVLSQTQLTDPWDIWRTAFRETAKLLYYASESNSIELHYRLNQWLTASNIWYKRGAEDAQAFFEGTDGDLKWLRLTSEWDWLKIKFDSCWAKQQT